VWPAMGRGRTRAGGTGRLRQWAPPVGERGREKRCWAAVGGSAGRDGPSWASRVNGLLEKKRKEGRGSADATACNSG
jgi:hypothetical protein